MRSRKKETRRHGSMVAQEEDDEEPMREICGWDEVRWEEGRGGEGGREGLPYCRKWLLPVPPRRALSEEVAGGTTASTHTLPPNNKTNTKLSENPQCVGGRPKQPSPKISPRINLFSFPFRFPLPSHSARFFT